MRQFHIACRPESPVSPARAVDSILEPRLPGLERRHHYADPIYSSKTLLPSPAILPMPVDFLGPLAALPILSDFDAFQPSIAVPGAAHVSAAATSRDGLLCNMYYQLIYGFLGALSIRHAMLSLTRMCFAPVDAGRWRRINYSLYTSCIPGSLPMFPQLTRNAEFMQQPPVSIRRKQVVWAQTSSVHVPTKRAAEDGSEQPTNKVQLIAYQDSGERENHIKLTKKEVTLARQETKDASGRNHAAEEKVEHWKSQVIDLEAERQRLEKLVKVQAAEQSAQLAALRDELDEKVAEAGTQLRSRTKNAKNVELIAELSLVKNALCDAQANENVPLSQLQQLRDELKIQAGIANEKLLIEQHFDIKLREMTSKEHSILQVKVQGDVKRIIEEGAEYRKALATVSTRKPVWRLWKRSGKHMFVNSVIASNALKDMMLEQFESMCRNVDKLKAKVALEHQAELAKWDEKYHELEDEYNKTRQQLAAAEKFIGQRNHERAKKEKEWSAKEAEFLTASDQLTNSRTRIEAECVVLTQKLETANEYIKTITTQQVAQEFECQRLLSEKEAVEAKLDAQSQQLQKALVIVQERSSQHHKGVTRRPRDEPIADYDTHFAGLDIKSPPQDAPLTAPLSLFCASIEDTTSVPDSFVLRPTIHQPHDDASPPPLDSGLESAHFSAALPFMHSIISVCSVDDSPVLPSFVFETPADEQHDSGSSAPLPRRSEENVSMDVISEESGYSSSTADMQVAHSSALVAHLPQAANRKGVSFPREEMTNGTDQNTRVHDISFLPRRWVLRRHKDISTGDYVASLLKLTTLEPPLQTPPYAIPVELPVQLEDSTFPPSSPHNRPDGRQLQFTPDFPQQASHPGASLAFDVPPPRDPPPRSGLSASAMGKQENTGNIRVTPFPGMHQEDARYQFVLPPTPQEAKIALRAAAKTQRTDRVVRDHH
ncbi:hypothetical protein B0H10DRAFT_1958481 [Mycena sp. CBHHK59/15]|nr:hypothetical protein B0H10DRAFT_1958481 [Mycena sp. CBHHK59/15]